MAILFPFPSCKAQVKAMSSANWAELKVESEKVGLKLNIQKTKIMASVPITSWQIDRKNVETVRFHLLGSKINVGNDCSHEIK